ncbi:MAG: cytochrome c oxidase accessory protein CcoG [Deltaproteobacteria bacterium HGW-Deltaproteobacteria-14]|jgi:cytochrome c oxidase accessory protein FixG|nr:MAG: cytochrome c oxidase accessory protein CcoG [Deltaproteobacteria bacterium HGW-Deltaproteobacteria-14]
MSLDKPDKSGPNLDTVSVLDERGSRKYVYPADAKGRWSRLKPWVYTILIAVYVALPFVHIGGHPAVHIDLPDRRFYLFGATYNSQDFYLAFFVLTGIGFALIVVAALWGRLWCGWACPQTVFLDGVFRRIERWIEGPASKRRRLADGPFTGEKVIKGALKHAIYLALSVAIAHVFLAYFTSVDTLGAMIEDGPAGHMGTFMWAAIFTAIIYGNFWWFREQLCIVICPYGRLQSVLQDRDTINVQYDYARGEPRGKVRAKELDASVGDCVDCGRCIAVCPTQIDIRSGPQLECIGCAYCIDACDDIMTKVGRPTGLIRYDSLAAIEDGKRRSFKRPRVIAYAIAGLILVVVSTIVMSRNDTFEVNVLRVQGAPYTLTDATIENTFRVHVVNKRNGHTLFKLAPADGFADVLFLPQTDVELDTFQGRELPVFAKVPLQHYKHGMEVHLTVTDTSTGEVEDVAVAVLGPRRPVRKAKAHEDDEHHGDEGDRHHGDEGEEKR